MKHVFLSFILIASLTGCTKSEEETTPGKIIVIYELESNTAVPFKEIKFGSGAAGATKSWDTSGIGIFEKTDTIKKGIGVYFEAQHNSSDKWKIRIKTPDGSLLIEGPVKLSTGTPSYYYSSIGATVN